ncbi:MCE family protein [Nocardioides jiangxiensis]|uniref:MlaD family protein n=1 Tax=Nocardioides jiangxiensis TaxID=3064524 RepID=A0ABT9AYS4_9ACTN|nr:MlaD family protein [Nocardioides sp. WY-20]MDO7867732.1 MlaD family protein [Nocardioides sp. WY-20]
MSRKGLDKRTAQDLVRLSIFMVITALATGLLAVTIGNLSFQPTEDYKAVFSDATGVNKGDDVRMAGVKIGSVKDVRIVDRTHAEVDFTVSNDVPVTDGTHLTVKFRNLVGQRYISMTQEDGATAPLKAGTTVPLDRTTPALDLTVLFNGFKPLFAALSPRDINKLSYEIVQVFQGEGGTLEGLLGDTASLTSTLADRDEIIGQLVDNLNTVLAHVGDRDEQLSSLLKSFRTLVGGLNKDRDAILGPLDKISELSVQTASLVQGLRPDLVADLKQLRRLSTNLDSNKGEIDRALQVLPIKLTKIGRTATYGSFFNFYLCEFRARVSLPGGSQLPIDYTTAAKRCDL